MGLEREGAGQTSIPHAGPTPLEGRRWWFACGFTLVVVLAATIPTTGDFGLTWDEPAYRYSQVISAQWWKQWLGVRSIQEAQAFLDPDALLYYWPYGRHGINFHPPLAGQLSLATHALFGSWVKDIPARRLASVFEYALTITIGFGFLARRYGPWVAGVMAGSLLCMPRVHGDGHIAGTDTPGLLLWVATALAFWKGLNEERGGRWRVLVGVLIGLAFVEKMAAVLVLLPLLAWLGLSRVPRLLREGKAGLPVWVDAVLTGSIMLLPLGLALLEILRLKELFPPPSQSNLYLDRPPSRIPGGILAVPLLVWIGRRALARLFPTSPIWGPERPALETLTAILGFAPVVCWLGNPAWWRETLPRLTHYYQINTDRRGSLPEIWIMYWGDLYEFSLPWHNGWVWIAIVTPVAILLAASLGMVHALRVAPRDRVPLYFLVHFLTWPILRMFPTPAHDGVRLLLPSFFFLAAFAGWGAVVLADFMARLVASRHRLAWRTLVAGLVVGSSAWQLVRVHPFELSYYNELIGGARGAWSRGFELTYWYDAFTPGAIEEINQRLPPGVSVTFFTGKTEAPTFNELQALGTLRGDIRLGSLEPGQFPYAWILTQDAKSSAMSRLLYAMKPIYALTPRQLDGLRVASVADPIAVSLALALNLLASGSAEPRPPAQAPEWVHHSVPWLKRFWGEGLVQAPLPGVNAAIFDWAREDPAGLRAAAKVIATGQGSPTSDSQRLQAMLARFDQPESGSAARPFSQQLLSTRPEAVTEAVEILISRPGDVRTVLERFGYTDPSSIGGYLDAGLSSETSSGGNPG